MTCFGQLGVQMEQWESLPGVDTGSYSYVLRLWCEDRTHRFWRISLQEVNSGERIGFANLGNLCDYLMAQIEASPGSEDDCTCPEEVK